MNFSLKVIFFFGLLLASPLIGIAMALIYFEDGGPTIFTQERLGKNKKIIKLYKIRTMKNFTPNLGTHEVDISNYLRTGSFLRKMKIDELPQVINFLKGDINIIGPRPCLPNQSELINKRESSGIFNSTPGITGLAQVLGYDMSNPEILTKIEKLYINKKSLGLDVLIFISTFVMVFRKHIKSLLKEDIENINNY